MLLFEQLLAPQDEICSTQLVTGSHLPALSSVEVGRFAASSQAGKAGEVVVLKFRPVAKFAATHPHKALPLFLLFPSSVPQHDFSRQPLFSGQLLLCTGQALMYCVWSS